MFGWSDLGWNERKGKVMRRSRSHFPYLVREKNWKGEVKQCSFLSGFCVNSSKFFPPDTGRKTMGWMLLFIFPKLPSSLPSRPPFRPPFLFLYVIVIAFTGASSPPRGWHKSQGTPTNRSLPLGCCVLLCSTSFVFEFGWWWLPRWFGFAK